MKPAALLLLTILLTACTVQLGPAATHDVRQAIAPPQTMVVAPDHPTSPNPVAPGAHSYEGDSANSITIQAGDVFTIHNPDFSRGYTFRIVTISADGITVATDEPNVVIRNNGSAMPYFIHTTESYATGYELPIGWARFTPLEKTPVVQAYSIQPGATIVRDDG